MSVIDEETLRKLEDCIAFVPNCGCWIWLGCCTDNGYAITTIRELSTRRVHRLLYVHYIGLIPSGMELDHLCRVRCCVNPWHLDPVTHQENVRRGLAGYTSAIAVANRHKTHCPQGHPYTEENTEWRRDGHLYKRRCRTCHREQNSARYFREHAA